MSVQFHFLLCAMLLSMGIVVDSKSNEVESYVYNHRDGILFVLPRTRGVAIDLRNHMTGEIVTSLVVPTKHDTFNHQMRDVVGSDAEELLLRVKTVSGTGISYETLKIFDISNKGIREIGIFSVKEFESMFEDYRKYTGIVEFPLKDSLTFSWSQVGVFQGKDLKKKGVDKYKYNGEKYVKEK